MKKNVFKLIALVGAIAVITNLNAQNADDVVNLDKPLRTWSVGVNAGVMMPYTDVRQYDYFRVTDPKSEYQFGVNAHVTKMFNNTFGLQGQLSYGKLLGLSRQQSEWSEDATPHSQLGFDRAIYFETNYLVQANANLYINLSNMFTSFNKLRKHKADGKIKRRKVAVYSYVGYGLVFFDSQLYELYTEDAIVQGNGGDYLSGYSGKTTESVFVLGGGLKYKLSRRFDLGLDVQYNGVLTDKLDALVTSGSSPFEQGGNDKYMYTSLGVNYKFGFSKKSQNEHIEWLTNSDQLMAELLTKADKGDFELKDSDKDGVADRFDQEKDTPAEARADSRGVTMDSDGDGCADHEDEEPFSSPNYPIENCRNVIPEVEEQPVNTLSEDAIIQKVLGMIDTKDGNDICSGWFSTLVFFDSNDDAVKGNYVDNLFTLGKLMELCPSMRVKVSGHADYRSSENYNVGLSQRRANAIVEFMGANFNIPSSRFVVEALGEQNNLVDGKSDFANKVNRRVQLTPIR